MSDFAETSDERSDAALTVELKSLPATLRYKFLGPNDTYPVIVNVNPNEKPNSKISLRIEKTLKSDRVYYWRPERYQSLHLYASYSHGG
jgi:hypothetical protein